MSGLDVVAETESDMQSAALLACSICCSDAFELLEQGALRIA